MRLENIAVRENKARGRRTFMANGAALSRPCFECTQASKLESCDLRSQYAMILNMIRAGGYEPELQAANRKCFG
ncbi:unnamed protein product, partial [Mesorhabditis spiculigera]